MIICSHPLQLEADHVLGKDVQAGLRVLNELWIEPLGSVEHEICSEKSIFQSNSQG